MIEVDACFVISLARRKDRLAAFCSRFPIDWTLPAVEAFAAVDGTTETRPGWWRATAGAWGCYRSHLGVLELCIARSIDRVLIFEDDATFVHDFSARAAAVNVPHDCEQLYLGGQHLATPGRGPDGLVVGTNVNRTHAYAVFGRSAINLLVDHLQPDPQLWKSRHHVDHHYGTLHAKRLIGCYAVHPWLCGQAGGQSDVGKGSLNERWWRR